MRVLVTGSRDWPAEDAIRDRLDHWLIGARVQGDATFEVMHGACATGADAHAARWIDDKRAQWGAERILEHADPADFRGRGRKAGPERNARMVARGADYCLAFIGPCTSARCARPDPHWSHGATGCARLAEEAGITTLRWFAPGDSGLSHEDPNPAAY